MRRERLIGLRVVHPTTPNLQEHRTCKTYPVLVCPGNDQSHHRRLAESWDERNGGNLTLRLDDADIARITTTSTNNRAISRSASPCLTGKYTVYCHRLRQILPQRPVDPAANLGVVKVDSDGAGYHFSGG